MSGVYTPINTLWVILETSLFSQSFALVVKPNQKE